MFAASHPRRLLPGLALTVLLLGCSVPEIDYYDAPDEGAAPADSGGPGDEESGPGVGPDVDGSDAGETAPDVVATDGTVEAQSPDAPVGQVDGESDAADDLETSDSATHDSGMTGSETPDSATADSTTLDSSMPDSTRPDVTTFDAPDSADAGSPDAFDAAEEQGEASTRDGSEDDADDGSANTCPQKAPPGAATCCAHTPCAESQGNACNCGKCDSMHCLDWCCANSQGGTTCVAGPADCH
jgi:hypothetical protein